MIDLHAHILPGIDDGAQDWDAAIAMLRLAAADGIIAIAATPHQFPDGIYCNRNERVVELISELRQRVQDAGITIDIVPGGEVFAGPDVAAQVDAGLALPYGPGKYLLLEFPASEVPVYARQIVFDLLVRGYTPVIAHPERNEGFADKPELLFELVEAGALAQLTAYSISRGATPAVRNLAALFLTHNLVHIMASDAHSPERRAPVLTRYAARIAQTCGEEKAHALVHTVPLAVVQGEQITVEPPIAFTRQSRRSAENLAEVLAKGDGKPIAQRRGLFSFLRRA